MTTIHISFEDIISFDYLYQPTYRKITQSALQGNPQGHKECKKIRSKTMYTHTAIFIAKLCIHIYHNIQLGCNFVNQEKKQ